MNKKDLLSKTKEFANTRMASLRPSHGWDHVSRVVLLALKIGKKEKADLFIVEVAALLHDIARGEEDASQGRVCHAARGAEVASEFLRTIGLSESEIKKIAHCISSHRYRGSAVPLTKEAKVLFDADKLDSIGAIGIGRAFLFAGEVGARLFNGDIDIHQTEAYSEEDTAYREFMVKLRHVKTTLQTREGKRLAQGRHDFMEQYFKRLKEEALGKK
jgi:uncharacterized protein